MTELNRRTVFKLAVGAAGQIFLIPRWSWAQQACGTDMAGNIFCQPEPITFPIPIAPNPGGTGTGGASPGGSGHGGSTPSSPSPPATPPATPPAPVNTVDAATGARASISEIWAWMHAAQTSMYQNQYEYPVVGSSSELRGASAFNSQTDWLKLNEAPTPNSGRSIADFELRNDINLPSTEIPPTSSNFNFTNHIVWGDITGTFQRSEQEGENYISLGTSIAGLDMPFSYASAGWQQINGHSELTYLESGVGIGLLSSDLAEISLGIGYNIPHSLWTLNLSVRWVVAAWNLEVTGTTDTWLQALPTSEVDPFVIY